MYHVYIKWWQYIYISIRPPTSKYIANTYYKHCVICLSSTWIKQSNTTNNIKMTNIVHLIGY